MKRGKLGILGGMGPQATILFYQKVIDLTCAGTDQEHIETMILSDTQIPDRTHALLSGHSASVQERLLSDARQLEDWGAGYIAIPCNTSHAFLPWLQTRIQTPIVNMIAETVADLQQTGARRVGILATDGTIRLGLYHTACQTVGIETVDPAPEIQKLVMSLIYDEIKRGKRGDEAKFAMIDSALRRAGCDRAVLACTELSVYCGWHSLSDYYLDAMNSLARRCVTLCGGSVRTSADGGALASPTAILR